MVMLPSARYLAVYVSNANVSMAVREKDMKFIGATINRRKGTRLKGATGNRQRGVRTGVSGRDAIPNRQKVAKHNGATIIRQKGMKFIGATNSPRRGARRKAAPINHQRDVRRSGAISNPRRDVRLTMRGNASADLTASLIWPRRASIQHAHNG